MAYRYFVKALIMSYSQKSDGIQIFCKGINYAHPRNIMAYSCKASSMPQSQEYSGIQIFCEGVKYASFTVI
jgi:hypothetical protein